MLSGLVDDDIVYYMQRDGYSRSGAVRTYHAYVASRIKPQHRLLGRSKTKSSQLFQSTRRTPRIQGPRRVPFMPDSKWANKTVLARQASLPGWAQRTGMPMAEMAMMACDEQRPTGPMLDCEPSEWMAE